MWPGGACPPPGQSRRRGDGFVGSRRSTPGLAATPQPACSRVSVYAGPVLLDEVGHGVGDDGGEVLLPADLFGVVAAEFSDEPPLRSGDGAAVLAQQSAQPGHHNYLSVTIAPQGMAGRGPKLDAAGPSPVAVIDVPLQDAPEAAVIHDQKPVQGVAASRGDPALGDRVGPRTPRWRAADFHPLRREHEGLWDVRSCWRRRLGGAQPLRHSLFVSTQSSTSSYASCLGPDRPAAQSRTLAVQLNPPSESRSGPPTPHGVRPLNRRQ